MGEKLILDNRDNGGGRILVYVREGILAKRREDYSMHVVRNLSIYRKVIFSRQYI